MAKRERVEYPKWFNPTAPAPRPKMVQCRWCKKSVRPTQGTKYPAGFMCDDCAPEPDQRDY